ncbi:MAG TPA: peptidoglycan DD-metalloendopeptidase family protein [Gammaproteobacteria bacterium]|nr:peptidoglycan DD-metalloendopeptidase family protein [Gammaproteobacteria bacterium]
MERARNILVLFSVFVLTQIVYAENIKIKLSEVKGQIQSLEKTIARNQEEGATLEQQLKTAELSIGKSSEQIAQFTKELAKQQRILNELNFTKQKTEDALITQNHALAEQLRAAYRLGTQNQLKIIFNQENLTATNRHLIYYKTLNTTRVKLINDIQQNLDLLQKTIRESETHQQTLKKLIAEKERRQKQQQRILSQRKQLISALQLQTQNKQQKIELLMANQKALQETISRLTQKEIALPGQAFNQLQKKLSWPLKGPLVSSFGSLLNEGSQRQNGALIKAPIGTPVHAIYSGKVIFADWLRGFGLLVIINHGHNYMSLYARNQSISAKMGHYVHTGEVIALSGNSGGYENPGLYFEVRQNGAPVNPAIWCR